MKDLRISDLIKIENRPVVVRSREMGDGDQKVKLSSYKRNNSVCDKCIAW